MAVLSSLLLLSISGALAQTEGGAPAVRVLFDFGDGVVLWGEAPLEDNRTAILATEVAADHLGLPLEVQWFPFGAFVADIGDRNPVWPFWWHFLLWNTTQDSWELAPTGASDTLLQEGEVIGWFLAKDNPPVPGTAPHATPLHPYPAVGFRGDLQNRGVTASAPPGSPGLQWASDLDGAEIGASAVARQGTVYQLTWNGTYALDLASGERLWHQPALAGLSTPALLEDGLVAGSRDGRLYRIDSATGSVVWSVLLQAGADFTGIASSPAISQARALIGTFNESGGPGRLVSINLTGGDVVWSVETGSIHMSSPAVADGAAYVGVMGLFRPAELTWGAPYGLLSVAEANGTERWFYATEGPVASSPVVDEGVVYFTSRDGYLYGVTVEGVLVFRTAIGPSTSSPAVDADRIYAASGTLGSAGNVRAVDRTGSTLWEFPPNGPVQSSLTVAAGTLLFATNTAEGTVYALNATDGSLLWTYRVAPAQYILATPVVVDGIVLIASDGGFLYALGPARAADPLVGAVPIILGAIVVVVLVLPLALYASRRPKE